MAEDRRQQDELFAKYWDALADDPTAPPPAGLDPTLAYHAHQLQPPDPSAEFVSHLEQQLRALPAANVPPDSEAAPLLRSGLPVRPVRRPSRRIAPIFSVAAALLVLLLGAALLAGMLAGRSRQIIGGTGPLNNNPANLATQDGQPQSSFTLTNADQIADAATHAWDGTNLPSFTANVIMTATEAPYSVVRRSKVSYQPPSLWHADNDDLTTTIGQPGQVEDTSTYILNGQNMWDSIPAKLNSYPPDTYYEMRYSEGFSDNCVGEHWLRTLLGSAVVAGRAAYVVTVQHFPCVMIPDGTPPPTPTPAPPSYTKYWLDQQSFLVLKKVYHGGIDNSDETQLEVTDIQFNPTLDANLFVIPTATPPSATGLAQLRQQVKFPIFVPTNLSTSLTPAPPVSDGGSLVHLFYYTRDGRLALDVTESAAVATSLSLLATPSVNSDGTTTLPNRFAGYFYLTPYLNCGYNDGTDNGIYGSYPDGRLSLVWIQDGTRISVGGPAAGSSDVQVSKAQLAQIAATISSTADLGATQMPPTIDLPIPQPTNSDCPVTLPASQPTGEPFIPTPASTYSPSN